MVVSNLEGVMKSDELDFLKTIYDKLTPDEQHKLNHLLTTLQEENTIDHLTGAYNRRAFERGLESAISKVIRDKEPLSLLMIDIDHFKTINDTYGHPRGDMILQGVALSMQKTLRKHELLYRYGGEEFSVILSDQTANEATIVAERLRINIAEYYKNPIEESLVIPVTISVGVANYTKNYSLATFLTCSDKALYQAKESGRNRVVLFQP